MTTTAEVWDKFHDNVYHFLLKRVKNETDAQDILQEVFIKIHLKKDSIQDESKLQAWIFQVARNAMNDFFRASSKSGLKEDLPDLEDEEVGFYGKQEMFCCLHPFVEELPDKYKEAIKLADLEGKKQQEVAEILNISLSGAKSRVQRAREILKTKFVSCCNFSLNEDGQLVGEQDCERCNP